MRFHSYLSSKNERRSCRNSESHNRCSKLPRKFELSHQISQLRGHTWHRLTVILIIKTQFTSMLNTALKTAPSHSKCGQQPQKVNSKAGDHFL